MNTAVKTSVIYASTTNSRHVFKIGYVDPGTNKRLPQITSTEPYKYCYLRYVNHGENVYEQLRDYHKRFTINNGEDIVVRMPADLLIKVLDEAIDWDDKIYCDLRKNKDSMSDSEYSEKLEQVSQLFRQRLMDCVQFVYFYESE